MEGTFIAFRLAKYDRDRASGPRGLEERGLRDTELLCEVRESDLLRELEVAEFEREALDARLAVREAPALGPEGLLMRREDMGQGMPPPGRGSTRTFDVLLGAAIVLLIAMLSIAGWSFLHNTLSFMGALGVVGFASVMVGILLWATLRSRNGFEGEGGPSRIRAKTR